MTTLGKVQVHCPGCGEKVEVSVVVKAARPTTHHISGYAVLEVEFDDRAVVHACPEVTP